MSAQQDRRIRHPATESFRYEVSRHGALYVWSPETGAQKIAASLTALGATRFDLKYGMGGLSYKAPQARSVTARKSSRVSANSYARLVTVQVMP